MVSMLAKVKDNQQHPYVLHDNRFTDRFYGLVIVLVIILCSKRDGNSHSLSVSQSSSINHSVPTSDLFKWIRHLTSTCELLP